MTTITIGANYLMNFNLKMFDLTSIPTALVQKAWGKDTWKAAMKNIFFDKFTGKDANSIVQVVDNLKKDAGDQVTIPLLLKLSGNGVVDDNILEGNEEALQYRDFAVTINQFRHAVRLKGKFEEQKSKLTMRTDAKAGLQTWLTELVDGKIFNALSTGSTADRTIYAGTATAVGGVALTDVFTPDLIGKAKRIAQMSNPSIRPVKVNGTNHWVMIIDPYQARDLKNNEKWISAQESANIRGEQNPIFSGALGMWDNVVIHENEQVIRKAEGAGSAFVGRGLFLGAQAAVMAVAKDTDWNEDVFDYGNQVGFAISQMFGIKKSQYKVDGTNLSDFACINVITSSKAD